MSKPEVPDFLRNVRVVLARPSHPGNIGAAARAMKTMGVTRLYLVAPKRFPDAEATTLASGAADVLENAVVTGSLDAALEGVSIACALTSRKRELTTPLAAPRDACAELLAAARDGVEVALVFGNETYGLSIDEVARCNRLVTIAGNPDYFSLNLGQAVQVMCYELFSQLAFPLDHLRANAELASHEEVEGFYGHLDRVLDGIGFYDRRNGERLMRRLRTLYDRASLERQEIDILRGMLKQIERRCGPDPYRHD